MEQQGIYERIKDRVRQMKEESQDLFFTEYLVKLDRRLIQEKHQLDLLETELNRNCQIYRQRLASVEAAVKNENVQEEHVQATVRKMSANDIQENQTVPIMDTQENQIVSATETQRENQTVSEADTQDTAQAVPSMGTQTEDRAMISQTPW